MDANCQAKLSDFGLAVLVDLSSKDELNGVVKSVSGTLNWIAPEILNDKKLECKAIYKKNLNKIDFFVKDY